MNKVSSIDVQQLGHNANYFTNVQAEKARKRRFVKLNMMYFLLKIKYYYYSLDVGELDY